jgi:hypothetical protein
MVLQRGLAQREAGAHLKQHVAKADDLGARLCSRRDDEEDLVPVSKGYAREKCGRSYESVHVWQMEGRQSDDAALEVRETAAREQTIRAGSRSQVTKKSSIPLINARRGEQEGMVA